MPLDVLTTGAAWAGALTGTTALALALRRLRAERPRSREPAPRLVARLASASHARLGPDTTVQAVLDLSNDGDRPVNVHVAEAEVEAYKTGSHGLRAGRVVSRVPLRLAIPPGHRERVRIQLPFEGALLPDGDQAIALRVVHERGVAETDGTTRA